MNSDVTIRLDVNRKKRWDTSLGTVENRLPLRYKTGV